MEFNFRSSDCGAFNRLRASANAAAVAFASFTGISVDDDNMHVKNKIYTRHQYFQFRSFDKMTMVAVRLFLHIMVDVHSVHSVSSWQ